MKTMIEIREATKAQASDIARLIMMAMTDDCCLHFCGVGHGLEDFLKMMTSICDKPHEHPKNLSQNALLG